MKKYLFLIAVIIILAIAVVYLGFFKDKEPVGEEVTVTTSTPTQEVEELEVPQVVASPQDGWKTYTNNQYGFSIKYPVNYEPVDTTSGWPKAVTLFEGPSGQSYYLAIEIWDNESEFDTARGYNVSPRPVFKKIGNKVVSLWNVNKDKVVDEMISTLTVK